jgi:hypothetical protein
LIDDPQELVKAAGLDESEQKAIGSIASIVYGGISRLKQARSVAAQKTPANSLAASLPANDNPDSAAGRGVATVAVMSLAAIAGALAVVGTVSLLALNGGKDEQPL